MSTKMDVSFLTLDFVLLNYDKGRSIEFFLAAGNRQIPFLKARIEAFLYFCS